MAIPDSAVSQDFMPESLLASYKFKADALPICNEFLIDYLADCVKYLDDVVIKHSCIEEFRLSSF